MWHGSGREQAGRVSQKRGFIHGALLVLSIGINVRQLGYDTVTVIWRSESAWNPRGQRKARQGNIDESRCFAVVFVVYPVAPRQRLAAFSHNAVHSREWSHYLGSLRARCLSSPD